MSNFTPLVTKTYDFDGDKVTVIFARLKRKDMLAVLPAYKRLNDADENSAEKAEAINDILNGIADSLPGYVKELTGLNDSKGNAITIETVVDEMYFMKLSSLIAADMMAESSIPGGNV